MRGLGEGVRYQQSQIGDINVAMCWALSPPFCEVTTPQILLISPGAGEARQNHIL